MNASLTVSANTLLYTSILFPTCSSVYCCAALLELANGRYGTDSPRSRCMDAYVIGRCKRVCEQLLALITGTY